MTKKLKIREIENLLTQSIYDPEEIKKVLLAELVPLESYLNEIEAVYKKGIDHDYIIKCVLENLKNILLKEVREFILENKNKWDLIQDKSTAEAASLKKFFEEAKAGLKKDIDIEKIKEKALKLYETSEAILRELNDQFKHGFSINFFKDRLEKSIISQLKEELKKQFEEKLADLKASELNQNPQIDTLKNEIKLLQGTINTGINIEMIKSTILNKIETVQNLVTVLESQFKQGINIEQVKKLIGEAAEKLNFILLETIAKKASKYLLFSIFPFAAPLLSAYEFIMDPNIGVETKHISIPDYSSSLKDFRFKVLNNNKPNEAKYTDVKFELLLNENPFMFSKILFQINAARVTEAFDTIANGMKDLVMKAWNLLGEDVKTNLKTLFNNAKDVTEAIGKMADGAMKEFKNIASVVSTKLQNGAKLAIVTAKQFLSDAAVAIPNAAEVCKAFIKDSVVDNLQTAYNKMNQIGEKIGQFSKNLISIGDEIISKGLKEIDMIANSLENVAKETIKTIEKTAGDVADFAVNAGKETVKVVGKTVDEAVDSTIAAGKKTIVIVEKGFDVFVDVAGASAKFIGSLW